MGPLFDNSLTPSGVQMRNDYGRYFFIDPDYYSSNIFVRSISNHQLIFVDVNNFNLHFHHLNLEVLLIKCSLKVNIEYTCEFIFRTSKLMLVIATWKLPRLSILLLASLNASLAILYALEDSFFSS